MRGSTGHGMAWHGKDGRVGAWRGMAGLVPAGVGMRFREYNGMRGDILWSQSAVEFAVTRKPSPKKPDAPPPAPGDDSPGAKLRRLVDEKRRGRNDKEIAAEAGMDPATFSRLLKGRIADPHLSTIVSILKAIGATLSDYERS